MIALFLLRGALSVTYVVSDFCPCDTTSAADVGCSCDPQNADPTDATYPIRRPDFLPRCPSTPLKSKLPLPEWLRSEIFCLRNDKRSTRPKSIYSDTFNLTYAVPRISPTPPPAASGAGYSYRESILTGAHTTLQLPGLAASTLSCSATATSVEFLRDLTQEVCSIPADSAEFTAESLRATLAQGVMASPAATTPLAVTVNGGDGVIRTLTATFLFNLETSELTSATVDLVTYAATETASSLTVRVLFRPAGVEAQPKSGPAGYSYNQPVIAARNVTGVGLEVNADSRGSFPMPFGTVCSTAAFTPLLFGVDTISGCAADADNTAVDLSAYTHVAKYGLANASRTEDWLPITNECTLTDPPFQKFFFFYERFGDVNNAQNRIVSAVRTCNETAAAASQRVVIATFLQRPQTTFRYKPPNPKVPGLPDDTFAPFA